LESWHGYPANHYTCITSLLYLHRVYRKNVLVKLLLRSGSNSHRCGVRGAV
jgi:hypothetical protein